MEEVLEEMSPAIEINNEKIAELQNQVDALIIKSYTVKGGKEYGEKLRAWLINDAKWNYSESVAVVKLENAVRESIEKINVNDEFQLLNIELKALNILFQKGEGKGYHSAFKYHSIIMPVIDILSTEVKKDEEIMERLKFQIAAYTEGLKPAEEVMDGIENNESNEAVL